MARNHRTAIVGVGIGVVGGAAAGLAFGVPSLTSAAPSAVVQQVDDTGDDDAPFRDAEPGARLRAALQDLVEDGTIDAEQADAVAEHLASLRPEGGRHGHGPHGRHGGPHGGEVVAEALGIDVETLREELRSGSSIADIAAANGVDVQAVIDAMVAEAAERLAQGVEDERLTQADADERLAEITERITDRIDDVPPVRD